MGHIISTHDVVLEGLEKTLYEIILDQSSDPIFCFNPEGRYLYINQAFSSAFNLMPSDIVGKKIWDIFPGEEGDRRFAAVKKAIETKAEINIDVKVEAVDGDRYYMTTATPILDENERPKVVICISKEITIRKQMEIALNKAKTETELKNADLDHAVKKLYVKSITDGLTSLYNRQHIINLLEEAINHYDQTTYPLTIALLDIDYYKNINDTFGHLIGDQALIEFCQMMKTSFDYISDIGRFGGEEFIIIFKNVPFEQTIDLLEDFRNKVNVNQFTIEKTHFTFSAGVSEYCGTGLDTFIHKVDGLMYQAKNEGRNRIKY